MSKKTCPYPGLRPFTEGESIYFKGRDLHVRQIIKQLEERKIIMITGASGDGKSSLVYAGVIPNARAGFFYANYNNWLFVDFRPERDPLHNLAVALSRQLNLDSNTVEQELGYGFSSLVDLYKKTPYYIDEKDPTWIQATDQERRARRNKAGNLFILADQFEEFFTNTENYSQGNPSVNAYTTVNLLLETAAIALSENLPIYVVFTMRSDFISQCVAFKGLPETIGYSQFFVPRLKRNELQQVIEEPAKLSDGLVSSRLAEVLINELRDGFDQLPVLQHALNQLWRLADNGNDTLDLIHLAQLAGMPNSYLSQADKAEFDTWFQGIEPFRKAFFADPKLSNILNAHANFLYEKAFEHYKAYGEWAPQNITINDAHHIIKVAFQSLTKIDDGRAVRNRMSLAEIRNIVNRPHISYESVCGVLNIFRLPNSTFVRPFINPRDIDTEYLAANTILDITHEALIRNWQILQAWEAEEIANLGDFVEFKTQLDRWTESDHSNEFLLATGPLNHFTQWYERCKPSPHWLVKYDESDKLPENKLSEAEAVIFSAEKYLSRSKKHLAQIEAAKKRRRRVVLVASLVMIGILSVFSFWAMREKAYAQEQQQFAEEQRKDASEKTALATQERNKAIEANKLAEQQRKLAELSAVQAKEAQVQSDSARRRAEIMRLLAQEQSELAQTEAQRAKQQEQLADKQRRIAVQASDSARTLSMLATAQSLAFKAQQSFDNPRFNLVAAQYAHRYNTEYGGNERDAAVHEALRFALESNGYDNTAYRSAQPLASVEVLSDGSTWVLGLDGQLNALDNTFVPGAAVKLESEVPINKAIFLPGYVLVSYEDQSLVLWDLESHKPMHLAGHTDLVRGAALWGNTLVTGSRDHTVKLWTLDGDTPQLSKSLQFDSRISTIAMAGADCWAGLQDGSLYHININNGMQTLLGRFSGQLTALNASVDGRILLAGTSKGNLRIYKLDGSKPKTLEVPNNNTSVAALAINPTASLLAVATSDKVIKLFDLADMQKKPILITDHLQQVSKLVFINNDQLLAHCADNSLRRWETQPARYAAMVQQQITKPLSEQEWQQLVGKNIPYPKQ